MKRLLILALCFIALSARPEIKTDNLVYVLVPGVLSAPVEQQTCILCITSNPAAVTQFWLAEQYGTTGLLAHNNLKGKKFLDLVRGQLVILIYGDWRVKLYQVTDLSYYKALQPRAPDTNFINLETGIYADGYDVWQEMFTGDHVTFMTCLSHKNKSAWGRAFIVAEPITPFSPNGEK